MCLTSNASYPSLLESSDIDGGFVAVLTYLRSILLIIDHPDLTHCILHYMLALPEKPTNNSSSSRPATLARRCKSETLIRKQAESLEALSPGLYTLEDMILGGLRSHSQQTIAATLRLLSTILSTRHSYAIPGLIKVTTLKDKGTKRSILAHDSKVDALLSLAEDLIDDDADDDYESHLQDARVLLEAHVCSAGLLPLPSTSGVVDQQSVQDSHSERPNKLDEHTINPDDPLLQCMLSLLDNFFSNEIETNLSLTQAFSVLASCGYTHLDGWFLDNSTNMEMSREEVAASSPVLRHPPTNNDPSADGEVHLDDPHFREPVLDAGTKYSSPVMRSLNMLVGHVDRFRQEIEDFEIYLAERKHVFKVGEEIESALKEAPTWASTRRGAKAVPSHRTQASGQVLSISERLLSNDNSASVSRASSPRGRRTTTQSAPTLVGRLSHLRISPSPTPSKDSSAYAASPLRRDSFSSTPSKVLPSPTGPANALSQRINVPSSTSKGKNNSLNHGSSEVSSVRSGSTDPEPGRQRVFNEVSLSKILTNVVILQEFVLELAAIVEVKASLFGEVSLV